MKTIVIVGFNHNTDFFTADYISIMESLVFSGSATSDRQCVNITILDDDLRETSIFNPQPEVFQVLLNVSEPNDAVQLEVQTASVSIQDDDCKYSMWNSTCIGCYSKKVTDVLLKQYLT